MSGTTTEEPDDGAHGLPALIAARRAKAQTLRQTDRSAFPYAFARPTPVAEVLGAYEHLQVGEETDERQRVAGRLAARRGHG
jgi:lysyl-tRNA synthetase class 2